MSKDHTYHRFDRVLADTQRARDYLNKLKGCVEHDKESRGDWEDKRAFFQRRRYGLEWRQPTFPWPGSSDIVLPLIDKYIDQLKPSYVNLVTSVRPPVTVHAVDGKSQAVASNVELWFEWLIKWGSPNFIEEVILATDDLLEMGRGILKSYWRWDTMPAPETITRERLPQRLRTLITAKNEQQAMQMMQAMQAAGVNGAVLTKQEFDKRKPLIQETIEKEYELDPEEARDNVALQEIMAWLRSGGREPLTVMKRDIVCDVPAVAAVSPLDLFVPENTTGVEEAERITHQMWMNEPQLKRRARDAAWDNTALKFVMDEERKKKDRSRSTRSDYEQDSADREGVDITEDNDFEIWETCSYYSEGPGKPDRKVVTLYHPNHPDKPFKFYMYQRPSMKWPYHTATFELNKRRWHSARGVPEIIDDLESEVTWQHRQKLNRMAIANAPSFLYRQNARINPRNFTFIPGQFYPVPNPQMDVVPLQVPNVQMSEEREEQVLRTWAEERLGSVDLGISSPLSSMTEPRTATEIRTISQRARASLSLRGLLFQRMMQEVYTEYFQMWHAFGPQEVWIRVTGGEQPIKLTKEDLQGQFYFQPTGTIGEQDPLAEAAKAQTRIQVLAQIKQLGLSEPQFEINMGEAVRDWLEKEDIRLSKRILRERSPEEIQQIVQEQQRQQQLAAAVEANAPLSLQELQEGVKLTQSKAPAKGAQRVDLAKTLQGLQGR